MIKQLLTSFKAKCITEKLSREENQKLQFQIHSPDENEDCYMKVQWSDKTNKQIKNKKPQQQQQQKHILHTHLDKLMWTENSSNLTNDAKPVNDSNLI